MRIPRDIGGEELVKILKKYGYQITRQTGGHIRLTTDVKGEHRITIPKHKFLRVGTISNILTDIASHLEIDKEKLVNDLFGKKKFNF